MATAALLFGSPSPARYVAAMRFSMKWLAAGMAYVAFAAAAIGQNHWAYSDALWLVSFVAICYAAAIAVNAKAQRRSRAIGFLIGSLLFAVAIHFADGGDGPMQRFVLAFQGATNTPYPMAPVYQPHAVIAATPSVAPGVTINYATPTPVMPAQPGQYFPAPYSIVGSTERIQAANSIGVVVAGVIGAILSAVAYRQCQRASDAA